MTSPARRNVLALTAVAGAGALVAGLVGATGASADAQPQPLVEASSSPVAATAATRTPVASAPAVKASPVKVVAISRSAARGALAAGTVTRPATPTATVKARPAVKTSSGTTRHAVTTRHIAARHVATKHATPAEHPTHRGPKPASAFGTPTSDLSASQMRLVQAELTVAGYEVPRTGHFGEMTQDAIRAFQKAHGLDQTGGPGPRTLAKLSAHETKARALLAREAGGQDRPVRASSSSEDTTSSPATHRITTTSAPRTRTVAQETSAPRTSTRHTSSSTTSSAARQAVSFAYGAIGTPYVYGGTGNGGYDCSGLTSAAWASAGVSIPRTSQAQMGLPRVSTSNLRPGDIIVYYGGSHVGIYVGDGMVVHAPRPGRSVEKVSMDSMPVTMAVRPA